MKPIEFQEAIEMQFDCLIKKVVMRTTNNYHKEISRRIRREVSLTELSDSDLDIKTVINDTYECYGTQFVINNIPAKVLVTNESLSKALTLLSDKRREIILLSYFMELSDIEIAELLGKSRTSIYRQRMTALKDIKKEMGIEI